MRVEWSEGVLLHGPSLQNSMDLCGGLLGLSGNFLPWRRLPGAVSTTRPPRLIFRTQHAARHLEGTNLSAPEVEAAITQRLVTLPYPFGEHWGWVEVKGYWIQYRAYPLPDGSVNVGTYVIVSGPLNRR